MLLCTGHDLGNVARKDYHPKDGWSLMVVPNECYQENPAANLLFDQNDSKFYLESQGPFGNIYLIYFRGWKLYARGMHTPNDTYVQPNLDKNAEVKRENKEYFWSIEKVSDGSYKIVNQADNRLLLFGEEPPCVRPSFQQPYFWGPFGMFLAHRTVYVDHIRRPSFALCHDLKESVLNENKLEWQINRTSSPQ